MHMRLPLIFSRTSLDESLLPLSHSQRRNLFYHIAHQNWDSLDLAVEQLLSYPYTIDLVCRHLLPILKLVPNH